MTWFVGALFVVVAGLAASALLAIGTGHVLRQMSDDYPLVGDDE